MKSVVLSAFCSGKSDDVTSRIFIFKTYLQNIPVDWMTYFISENG